MKYGPIPLTFHALIDVALTIAGFSAPWFFGYSDQLLPTLYTLAVASFGLVMNSITNYPVGIWRALPFSWHKAVEFTAPVPFIAVPWLYFPQATEMKWFLTALGTAIALNAFFTHRIQVAEPAASARQVGV
jgi:hypothetical protein